MYNDPNTVNQPVDTLATDQTTMNQQFMEGTPVYDVNGDKVGTVSEHGVQDNALVIHHGLLRDDVYIPLTAIDSNDANGVYLTITKDDALHGGGMTSTSGAMATNADMDTMTTGSVMGSMAPGGVMGSMAPGVDAMAPGGVMDAAAPSDANRTGVETDQVNVPVRQEELVAGKQQEEIGRVHLHKDVIEEQQTITEPVTREEVRVERVPVQGQYSDAVGADAFTEKDIDVPVMGEELVAGKRTVVNEEVRLSKQAVTENQQVSDTVRKERVTVDGADEVYSADKQNDPRK